MSLSTKPELNPEIKQFFRGLIPGVKSAFQTMTQKESVGFGYAIVFFGIVAFIALFVWYSKHKQFYETPDNIRRLAKEATIATAHYEHANPSRIGLRQYIRELKAKGVPDTHLCLGNFYVSSGNAGGIYLPGENGIVSPMATRAALLAGVRGIVFDIWPDLTPGANFGPVIQVVESGSLWRRISMNQLPFASILQDCIRDAFETPSRPNNDDPLFLYLRFRGGKPRSSTFTGVANALQTALETYRLPTSFNNARGQDRIFNTPITSFFKKVVIFSNTRAFGNIFDDYINVGPKDGIQLEWNTNEARGLGIEAKANAIRNIQQNLTWVAPFSESQQAYSNYDFKPSHDIGIQFVAMNFFHSDSMQSYRKVFEKSSFALKPETLRYVVEVLPKPRYPENPNWGTGRNAGTPVFPPPLRLP